MRLNVAKRVRLFLKINPEHAGQYDELYLPAQRQRAAAETDPAIRVAADAAGLTTETVYLRELSQVRQQGNYLLTFGPGLHDFDASHVYWETHARPATKEDIELSAGMIDVDTRRRPVVAEWVSKPLSSHPWLLQHCGALPPVDAELARAKALREEAAKIEAEIATRTESEATWAALGESGGLANFTEGALKPAALAEQRVAPNTRVTPGQLAPNTRIASDRPLI